MCWRSRTAQAESDSDRVALIAFEVDDQTPEDLAIALDHLRAHPAVLDVLQVPAFGKKGRMTAHIQVLAQPEAVEQVIDACFSETATLGLRCQIVERRVLARRQDVGRGRRTQAAGEAGATPGCAPPSKWKATTCSRCAADAPVATKRGAQAEAEGLKKEWVSRCPSWRHWRASCPPWVRSQSR